MSRSMHALQAERLPYNHHLHQFLTFLKHERGFADATIVNRERSLKPFLPWLVAQDVPLSTVSPVVITKYFISAVAGSGGGLPSRSMYSRCARSFATPAVEVGARRASPTHPGATLTKICRKARRGKRWESFLPTRRLARVSRLCHVFQAFRISLMGLPSRWKMNSA